MKKIILNALLCAATSMLIFSCKKNDIDTTPQTNASLVSSDPTLSVFAAIIARSGDATTVNGYATILAPVDSAFANAGITTATVASMSTADCDSIIKYYAISSSLNFANSSNAETAFTSQLGITVEADSTSGEVFVNGDAIIPSTTAATTGTTTVYKLTKFIPLPSSTIAQLTTNDASLSLFNEALNRTGFAANLTSGTYTLFAPTNDAFNRAGYPDIASIDAADINVLTQILQYNTVATTFFANDLLQQNALTSLQTGSIQIINLNGNLQLVGNSSSALPADIISNGQLAAGNVWVYKTDNLLLP